MLKDNIDLNAKSKFVKSRYHGTGISAIQFVTHENLGHDFPKPEVEM